MSDPTPQAVRQGPAHRLGGRVGHDARSLLRVLRYPGLIPGDRAPFAARPVGCGPMNVVALAGGIGAGKFLRGLVRAVPPRNVTVVVNTADDIELHGLHVSPDLDSVTYWLGTVMDRERGWGRRDETFRATEELRLFGADGSWFGQIGRAHV